MWPSIAAYWYGTAAVEGFVHELLGWVMFIVAFALMAAWAKAIGGRGARPELAPQ